MPNIRETWSGDWEKRLSDRLDNLGLPSVAELFSRNPGVTIRSLCDSLGEDVAPVQLTSMFVRESLRAGRLDSCARDLLARRILLNFPQGWELGERPDSRRAAALGDWIAELTTMVGGHLSERLESVCSALREIAPLGWIPSGGDDPIVRRAFDQGWTAANG